MAEEILGIFGHALDFQGKDVEAVHHGGHAGRNHAQVFPARKHAGGAQQGREFLEGAFLPEIVVAAPEKVFRKLVVTLFQVIRQPCVALGLVAGDARVPEILLAGILHKEAVRAIGIGKVEAHAAELFAGIGEGRVEVSHEAALVLGGDFPDAEEAQDVVYAEGVEVLCHLAHALFPPQVAVFFHLFPVVGGEAPVLAILGKGIRRCSGLAVHVEQFRELPGISTGTAYADGKVSLEGHPMQVGVGNGLTELFVQQVLQEAVEIYGGGPLRIPRHKTGYGFGGKLAPGAPGREVRGAGFVPQDAENGVGAQPVFVGIHKGLVLGRLGNGLPFGALVEFAQEGEFGLVHGFVVNGREGFQSSLLGLVGSIGPHSGPRQVDEHGVQREGAHGVVGVRILPGMEHGGVVDGEELDYVLVRLYRPVHQFFKVVEFSYAKAVFRTQGEHRNGHAGTPPGLRGEFGLKVGDN